MLLQVPVQLLRFPALLLGLCVTSALLVVAAAGSGLFLSSAGAGAVALELAPMRDRPALTVATFGPLIASFAGSRTAALDAATDGLPDLGPAGLSLSGITLVASTTKGRVRARVVARDGFLGHVHTVGSPGASGLWASGSAARRLGVGPGDGVTIEAGGREVVVPLAGIVRSLPAGERDPFWEPVAADLHGPFLLGEPGDVIRLLGTIVGSGRYRWDFSIERPDITLGAAQGLGQASPPSARTSRPSTSRPARCSSAGEESPRSRRARCRTPWPAPSPPATRCVPRPRRSRPRGW